MTQRKRPDSRRAFPFRMGAYFLIGDDLPSFQT